MSITALFSVIQVSLSFISSQLTPLWPWIYISIMLTLCPAYNVPAHPTHTHTVNTSYASSDLSAMTTWLPVASQMSLPVAGTLCSVAWSVCACSMCLCPTACMFQSKMFSSTCTCRDAGTHVTLNSLLSQHQFSVCMCVCDLLLKPYGMWQVRSSTG